MRWATPDRWRPSVCMLRLCFCCVLFQDVLHLSMLASPLQSGRAAKQRHVTRQGCAGSCLRMGLSLCGALSCTGWYVCLYQAIINRQSKTDIAPFARLMQTPTCSAIVERKL